MESLLTAYSQLFRENKLDIFIPLGIFIPCAKDITREKDKKVDDRKRNRIIIDIDEGLHRESKARAALRGQTLRKWIELAIKERILSEQKYE